MTWQNWRRGITASRWRWRLPMAFWATKKLSNRRKRRPERTPLGVLNRSKPQASNKIDDEANHCLPGPADDRGFAPRGRYDRECSTGAQGPGFLLRGNFRAKGF